MAQGQVAIESEPAGPRFGILIQVGLLAAPFMSMIDGSIVNVALPDIASSMHATLAAVQWVASAYLLTLGMALSATAFLAKRFGTSRVYRLSLIGFSVASALCAVSPGVAALVAARMLQGLFGAALVPLAMNMLLGDGEARKRMSWYAGMLLFLAPAIGPTLGGVLIRWAGWPAIFLVNVPLGLIAVFGVLRLPPAFSRAQAGTRFDSAGFALLAAGLALVTYGASQGPQAGWLSSSAWPFWLPGALLLAAYGVFGARSRHPILDLKPLRRPQAALALGLTVIAAVVSWVVIILVPAFMQEIQGRSAWIAGLTLLPQGLVVGIGTLLGDRWLPRLGLRTTVTLGTLILTASTLGLLAVTLSSPAWLIAVILTGRGVSTGLVIQPLLTELIGRLPSEEVPDGNTLFNVANRVGGSFGIALVVTFFELRERLRVKQALVQLGIPTRLAETLGGPHPAATMPPAVARALANAATVGFHDVVWMVAAIGAAGILASAMLKGGNASAQATGD